MKILEKYESDASKATTEKVGVSVNPINKEE
jgi:hypothetical protein